MIRLKLPELTQDRREKIVKLVHKLQEEARVGIRQIRRQFNDNVKEMEKNKEMSQDEQRAFNKEIQDLTNSYIKKVDEIGEQKEQQILQV